MYGAMIGDIIGSTYELHNQKSENIDLFPPGSTFTDDTVLTVATADKILHEDLCELSSPQSYAMWYRQYYRRYPHAGFGQMFSEWASSDDLTVQRSYGNGGAMRVSAIAFAYESIPEIRREVKYCCHYTHNHKEAIRGAQAAAVAVFLARKQLSQDEIRTYLRKKFHLPLDTTLDEIRDTYVFDSRASYCVPPAIEAFLESDSYEDAVRKAVSIGGDSDTIACMAGGIAHAFYQKIPSRIFDEAMKRLDIGLKRTADEFEQRFKIAR